MVVGTVANVVVEAVTVGSVDDACSDDGNVVVEGVLETVCFVGSVDVGFISSVDGSVDDAVEAVANVVEELDEVSSVNLVFLDDLKTF